MTTKPSENVTHKNETLVIDESLAPAPSDLMSNQQFDPDLYRAQRRINHARTTWHHMVGIETQIRHLDNGISRVVDGQGNEAIMQLPDLSQRDAARKVAVREAERLRKLMKHLLPANEIDEVTLIRERINFLKEHVQQLTCNLIDNEELRDHPHLYGWATDDQRLIDAAQVQANIAIIEVALADAKAELKYYNR